MKIAYFCDNFYPQVNGVLYSSLLICDYMVKKGHDVLYIAIAPGRSSDFSKDDFPFNLVLRRGVNALFYPGYKVTWPFSLSIVFRMLKFEPDIIHFHTPLSLASQGILSSKLLKIPLIGTFHTFFAEEEALKVIGLERFKFLTKLGWKYSKLIYNRCDLITAPTNLTKRTMIENGIKPPIYTVPNGIDLEAYRNAKKIVLDKKQYGLDRIKKDDKTLVFVGRVSVEKSIDVLIKAMPELVKYDKKVKLVIIGDGPEREKLEEMTKKLNVAKNIIFTGEIPHQILMQSRILEEFSACVSASTFETQGYSVIECMMYGLPAVVANKRGLKEVIGKNGYKFIPGNVKDYADKVIKLLYNPGERAAKAQESLKLIKNYSMRSIGKLFEKVYTEAILIKNEKRR